MKWYERLAEFLANRGRYRSICREVQVPMELRLVGTVMDPFHDETGIKNTYTPATRKELYLERWYIVRNKWLGIYLHRFWADDEDPPHDHPWNNFSWIIGGGYWERLPDGQRLWRPKGFRKYRTAEEFHSIEIEEPGKAWSLFFRFKRRRKWGFWHPEGWKEAVYQGGE